MRDIVVLLSNSKSLSSIHIYLSPPIRFQYRSSEILRGEEAIIFRFHDTTCITTTARFDGPVYSVSAFLRPFPSICIPVPGIGWKPVVPTKFQESANQTFLDGCSAHSVPSRPLSRGEEGWGKPCAGSRVRGKKRRRRRERENSFDHRNFAFRGQTRSNIQFRVQNRFPSSPRNRTPPSPLCVNGVGSRIFLIVRRRD